MSEFLEIGFQSHNKYGLTLLDSSVCTIIIVQFLLLFITGHEACFVAFLCCLFKLRVLDQSDYVSIVFKVFQRQVTFRATDGHSIHCISCTKVHLLQNVLLPLIKALCKSFVVLLNCTCTW